jgi:ribosomal protein L12E/L44/L45/RPP1/RPP2
LGLKQKKLESVLPQVQEAMMKYGESGSSDEDGSGSGSDDETKNKEEEEDCQVLLNRVPKRP